MNIAVNTRLLLPGRLDGIGHYTHETLRYLTRKHPEHRFFFLFDRPFHEQFIYADNIRPLVVSPPARHPVLFYTWFEWAVPRALAGQSVDLFFSPDNFCSLRLQAPTYLIIHDLAFEHYPRDVSWAQRRYYQYFVPRFARRADRIGVVSEATQRDLVQRYYIDPAKTDLTYVGLNEGIVGERPDYDVRARYSNHQPYFLFVGTIQPRKNLVRALRAFDIYKDRTDGPEQFLLVGRKGWRTTAIFETYERMQHRAAVHFLEGIDNTTLGHLYGSAEALLLVSYFEGFGMPAIEAQAHGCPVIAAGNSSLPEVAGPGALLVDPFSTDQIVGAMMRIRQEPQLAQRLRQAGLENVKRFSWPQTAERIWGGIERVLAE